MYALTFVREIKRETMGAMHETFSPLTAKDIAKGEGVNIATIRFRWNKVFAKGTFDSNRELSQDEVAAISQQTKGRTAKPAKPAPRKAPALPEQQPATVNQPAPASEAIPPAPGRAKFEWPAFKQIRYWTFSALAVAIVCGHGFLIWQEAAALYGSIGNIGGAVIFAVVCLAVLIASDSSRNRTSSFALWFMLLVDYAPGLVHYEGLHTPVVPHSIPVGFCIFICASSFVALLLYRDSKLD